MAKPVVQLYMGIQELRKTRGVMAGREPFR
jgi:hypothetical protein